jgi:hypothetical protein
MSHLDRHEITRRALLRLTAAGVVGVSTSGWFGTLASNAAEAAANGVKHKSCILMWMAGGPAQSHTFDLKDGGDYKAIDTTVEDIQVSEYLPKVAQQMQHLAILRGMSTGEASHGRARYLMHTGYRQGSGGVTHPSLGSIVSCELGQSDFPLPNFVSISANSLGAGYLGPKHEPLNMADPTRGVENLKPYVEMQDLQDKADLLADLDRAYLDKYQAVPIEAHHKGYQRAVQLMQSEQAKAFDLDREPASVREAYGKSRFGDGCLLARRLVEVGVPFVEVSLGGWDTHGGAARPVKNLSAQIDPPFARLVADLKERGLLDTTLVIWMGEFGRSPKNGSNHFARAWSTVLGGAGLKTGQVIGRTDKTGGTVEEYPISTIDFMATVCKALGIDHNKQVLARNGRPFRLVDKGARPIEELFA